MGSLDSHFLSKRESLRRYEHSWYCSQGRTKQETRRKRSDRKVHFMRFLDICHNAESEDRIFFIWGCELETSSTRLGLSTEATSA